eukprot:338717_1
MTFRYSTIMLETDIVDDGANEYKRYFIPPDERIFGKGNGYVMAYVYMARITVCIRGVRTVDTFRVDPSFVEVNPKGEEQIFAPAVLNQMNLALLKMKHQNKANRAEKRERALFEKLSVETAGQDLRKQDNNELTHSIVFQKEEVTAQAAHFHAQIVD